MCKSFFVAGNNFYWGFLYLFSLLFLLTKVFFFCFRCFRPFSDDELRSNAPQVVTCNDYQREVAVSQNIAGKHIDRIFTFDKVKLELNLFCF